MIQSSPQDLDIDFVLSPVQMMYMFSLWFGIASQQFKVAPSLRWVNISY